MTWIIVILYWLLYSKVILFNLTYLAFIFILPAVVKHKDFKYEFKNPNNSKQGLVFDIKDLKVSTKWNLSAGLNAKKINAYFNNKKTVSVETALSEYIQHLTKLNNRINKLMNNYFITNPIYKIPHKRNLK